jgi:D-beta-D-heptose 7-phosphate kinase/D-beta-D-heptose 1-phosphate adenosyltransferase
MLIELDKLQKIREEMRQTGGSVVFTNGCFDVLHRGHVEYLEKAKALGDILIVGLNSDDSVRRLKGEKRPLNTQEDRGIVLSALRAVDYVLIFEEDTPAEIISKLIPDVLVKGGDYDIDEIVGRKTVWENGGDVITIPEIKGRSTKGLIQKVLERYSA